MKQFYFISIMATATTVTLLLKPTPQNQLTPDGIKTEVARRCLALKQDECVAPYLIYNKLVIKGFIAHTGFVHVKKDTEPKSWALNHKGRAMSPDLLLQGNETVEAGYDGSIIGVYPVKDSDAFQDYLEKQKQNPSKYSALELNDGKNCAGFVEETMQFLEYDFCCQVPFLWWRMPVFCHEKSK